MTKFHNAALGNIDIEKRLLAMQSTYMITPDIEAACQLFPCFKFDPRQDADFFKADWWHDPPDQLLAPAAKLKTRFESWYNSASINEKAIVGVAALTNSSEQLDLIVDNMYHHLQKVFHIDMIDADGKHFTVDDFAAMRVEDNLNTVVNATRAVWWAACFEQQIRRVAEMPTLPFTELRSWYKRVAQHNKQIHDHYRSDLYAKAGTTKKVARRVFNRSYGLFVRTFGSDPHDEAIAKKFLRGDNLEIRGTHFVWNLKLDAPVFSETVKPSQLHSPFEITIHDQQMNKLANACVLFPEMPPLDQAVGFALHIAHPEDELDFMRKANLFNLTPLGRKHELLLSMPHISMLAPFEEGWPRSRFYAQCPTIDDGWVEDDSQDYEEETSWRRDYHQQILDEYGPDILDDDYARAFAAEYDFRYGTLPPAAASEVNDLWATPASEINDLWAVETRLIRRHDHRHPVKARLREKLMEKIDADPDILHYMMFPEFHFIIFDKIDCAPRLEAFITAKIPFRERNF